ncbi:tRNA (uracil(54)-C(5))-methyltransferase [Diutina catenulata]
MTKRAQSNGGNRKRKYKAKKPEEWSPLGVLEHAIAELLAEQGVEASDAAIDIEGILNDDEVKNAHHKTFEGVKVLKLTSNGDGLALVTQPKPTVVVVPFAFPGDTVTLRVFKSHPKYAEADLLKVESASELRDDTLINCRYFGKCSGCQFQNVAYDHQLELKRKTIVNAYRFFAKNTRIPEVSPTQPSPLQYNYRTKLTPHFNVPYSYHKHKKTLSEQPPLGFGAKGKPEWRKTAGGSDSIVDIEECAIGTPIVNQGMANERARFATTFNTYTRGATVLLRENTTKAADAVPEGSAAPDASEASTVAVEIDSVAYVKTCTTNTRQIVHEVVDGYTFEFSAGEFFQNNNSILPAVTSYVKSHLALPGVEDPVLVDAYCGSGLFSITCSKGVSRVIGVEVSADSVAFANRNAATNNVANAQFIVGKAEKIFDDIDADASKTSVILDPPRKGCDEVFLSQLAAFNPAKIVYISCNVHSQARDVDYFVNHTPHGAGYSVVEVKGFDFFPNTHHVESVAVLTRL